MVKNRLIKRAIRCYDKEISALDRMQKAILEYLNHSFQKPKEKFSTILSFKFDDEAKVLVEICGEGCKSIDQYVDEEQGIFLKDFREKLSKKYDLEEQYLSSFEIDVKAGIIIARDKKTSAIYKEEKLKTGLITCRNFVAYMIASHSFKKQNSQYL